MLAPPAAPVAAPKFASSVRPPMAALWTPDYLPVKPNGLTFIDIFCGAGGSSLGMVAAGYELVLAANHWPVAIRTHANAFARADHLCFAAGTLVLTSNGHRRIEDIEPGELVLTHKGRWRPVVRKFTKTDNTVIMKSGLHSVGTEVTPNHEYWMRRSVLQCDTFAPWPGSLRRSFAPPEWVPIGEAVIDKTARSGHERHAVALPATFGDLPWEDPPEEFGDPLEAWWLIGRWIGDGYASKSSHRIAITCGRHEVDELRPRIPEGWGESDTKTAWSFYRYSAKLYDWITTRFGHGADGKNLPGWTLTMPEDRRRALLAGYLSADGNTRAGSTRAKTVSKPLAMGIRMLAHSLGLKAGLGKADKGGPAMIQGRTVNCRPSWVVKWQDEPKKATTITDDLHCWALLHSVESARENVQVYTMEVAEDHSYVADGIVVKNCRDINAYDMRKLPKADVLWASPICWEVSQAGGNNKPNMDKYRALGQRDLFDAIDNPDNEDDTPEPDDSPGWERTRATAYDVIRATEVWKYKAIIIENVVEFATRWDLFEWWIDGMAKLGYRHHIVCVNSAHVEEEDNPAAPQWRDRMYIVFLPVGVVVDPELFAPRPWAHCFECGEDVQARQWWKPTKQVRRMCHLGKIGKYGRQYVYVCPNAHRHTGRGPMRNGLRKDMIVEPYVRPAASIIDWAHVGPRIRDRKRPLEEATWTKILKGIDMMRTGATMIQVTHAGHDGRLYRPEARPLAARTTKGGDGVVMPPFVVELRGGASVGRSAYHPMSCLTANGRHHGIVSSGLSLPIDAPHYGDGHGLVIPYRNEAPRSTHVPLHTLGTKASAGLLIPDPDLDPLDLHFRMLFPREHLLGQRFPEEYQVIGTGEQKSMQAGNAVSSNVPQWLTKLVALLLGATV